MQDHIKKPKEGGSKLRSSEIKMVTPGECRIYSVGSSLDLIRAVASIYSTTLFFPELSEILFCSRATKQYEVESFIIRALYARKNFP